jgi:hypothetical protein
MSDENFLSRWSRRKRSADESPAAQDASREASTGEAPAPAAIGASDADEVFDVSTLPPIDSITSLTDVSVFLRKGVPLELSRAALRRAWTSDPGIRDFVGLAENAWDFNDPNAMAGFGPLDHSPEQVREMVRQAFGEFNRASSAMAAAEPASPQPDDHDEVIEEQAADLSKMESAVVGDDVASSADMNVDCSRQSTEENLHNDVLHDAPSEIVRRTHGGAIPR